MITYLNGTLAYKGQMLSAGACLVVEVNGVGYQVLTSDTTLLKAPALHEAVMVHTAMVVREDAMQLVGFLTREERELFELLGTASGVGPRVALALMSTLTVAEVAGAIMTSDYKRLTAAKGVGPKLAQKLTIELKDKLSKWRAEHLPESSYTDVTMSIPRTASVEEAETVLVSLGYSMQEIMMGLQAIQQSDVALESLSAEDILQRVLKWLATHPVA